MDEAAYPQHLHRLQEEQDRALTDTHGRLQQWHKFRSDYEALSTRLKTLPDKVTHDVMVPFGKMGFMPGQLVHTNEIMVLLGDNWFAERSARQARELVDRRIAAIDEQLGDLEKQHKLLLPRQEFTTELLDLASETGGMREIKEQYDEEKERQRKVERQKRAEDYKRRRPTRPQVTTKVGSEVHPGSGVKGDGCKGADGGQVMPSELWERLNELERLETERQELHSVGSATDVPGRELRLVEDEGSTSSDEVSSYSSSSAELDSDDYASGEVPPGGTVINFSHTTTQNTADTAADTPDVPASDGVTIATPAEIYARFHTPGPTSILKKKSTQTDKKPEPKRKVGGKKVRQQVVGFDLDSDEDDRQVQRAQPQSMHPAFTGSVVEKSELPAPGPVPMAAPAAHRPVSKFKSRSTNQVPQSSSLANQNSPTVQTVMPTEQGANQNRESGSVRPVSKFKARRQNLQKK